MHVCGQCQKKFKTEKGYNEHVCEKTGFAANSIEHQDALTDGNYSKIAASAQQRGAEQSG